jgi:hypothetical protein
VTTQTELNPDKRVSLDDLLAAVPLRNRLVECAGDNAEELVLRVPRRKRWFMRPPVTLVLPVRTHRKVALDMLGREVWHACDGRRTIEQIIDAFAEKHHLSFHEARVGIMEFLKGLTRRGMIVIAGSRAEGSAA